MVDEVCRVSKVKLEFFLSMSYEFCILMNGLFGMIELVIDNFDKSNIYFKKVKIVGR